MHKNPYSERIEYYREYIKKNHNNPQLVELCEYCEDRIEELGGEVTRKAKAHGHSKEHVEHEPVKHNHHTPEKHKESHPKEHHSKEIHSKEKEHHTKGHSKESHTHHTSKKSDKKAHK